MSPIANEVRCRIGHILARVRVRSQLILKKLFEIYLANTRALPEDFRLLVERDGAERAVCDYVSGMTDRYALDEWDRFKT